MDSTTFIPMYDIEHLDENQKATYYRDACNFLGIPANLNLLAYIEMVVGDSGRHLVLYAKKGATDLIRQNRGISTISLEAIKDLVPGQVCFIAVGKDVTGREERAVGTADIDGMRGKALSDAIMIAQTRATRRMTLQFVGGGILDESEIPSSTALTNNVALDAITSQPVVLPNPTPSIVEPPPYDQDVVQKLDHQLESDAQGNNRFEEMRHPALASIENPAGLRGVNDFLAIKKYESEQPTPAQKDAQEALAAVKPETLAVASGESFKRYVSVTDIAATLPKDNPLAQAAAPVAEPPKQRKRKQAGLTLNTPEQESQPAVAQASAATPALITVETARAAVAQLTGPAAVPFQTPQQNLPPTLPAQAVVVPPVEKLLNPEEEKAIKERLAKYRNEILPIGGMVPVDQVGGVEIQLRKFVGKFNVEKPSSKTWNYADWLKFVDFLDDVAKTRGATGLVKYMQQVIGIAQ